MRDHCADCGYPAATCLCEAIDTVHNKTEVIILQHPSEATHAKNTVKLLQLSLANISVFTGKNANDFIELVNYLASKPLNTAVLYPSEHSKELPTAHYQKESLRLERLLFIDGSWKQAYGIWKNNPWLNDYPFYKLNLAIEGQYHIRKSKRAFGFSTLEAVAHTLKQTEKVDPEPLFNLLTAFTEQWESFIQSR